MAYVSIVERLQDRLNLYFREAYTNLDLYNEGSWDGDTSYMFNLASQVEAKIEKVKKLMNIEVYEHVEYDFGGYPYVLLWEVAVNGKMQKRWFRLGDTLPDGTKIQFRTIEQ